ncbi:MAG TPA: metallopeptidase TldD-related protein [Bacilli bacterium]|nr:metallopeptidase TldD-related protein [Bacilli bacterium]
MNVNKFFELAKEAGLLESEVVIVRGSTTQMGVYKGAVENYSVATTITIAARGIFNGKMGFALSEKDDRTTPHYLIDQIKTSAGVSESDDLAIIFEGSEKYRRRNIFNRELAKISESDKLNNLFLIEKALFEREKRVTDVESVVYVEQENDRRMFNSYGLKLMAKQNYYYYMANVVVREDGDTKTGYHIFLDNDHEKFDLGKFVGDVIHKAVTKLGGKPVPTKAYPVVLNPRVTASLLAAYLTNANAENVEKQTSLFIGKLNERVANAKITVTDAPLTRNVFFTYFDDEGVAKFNKPIIQRGVLKTYLHNLSTAKKAGVEPTGNAVNNGGKIGIGISNVVLRPGRKTFAEMITPITEGVFITEVMGLHSGLNPTSGDFSLQASGFVIRDGKLAEPVNLITVSGNLIKLFNDVRDVANENELQLSSYTTSSVYIKKLNIAG